MQVYNKTKFHSPDMSFRFDFCNLQCYSNDLFRESCSTAIHFTFQKKFTPPLQLSNASGRTQSRSYKRKTGTRLIALFQLPGMIKTSSPIFLKCTLLPLRVDTTRFLRSRNDKSPRWGISEALRPIACRHVC